MNMVFLISTGPNIERDLVIHYNPTTGDCTARVVVLKDDARFSNLSHIIVWCYSSGDPYCQVIRIF